MPKQKKGRGRGAGDVPAAEAKPGGATAAPPVVDPGSVGPASGGRVVGHGAAPAGAQAAKLEGAAMVKQDVSQVPVGRGRGAGRGRAQAPKPTGGPLTEGPQMTATRHEPPQVSKQLPPPEAQQVATKQAPPQIAKQPPLAAAAPSAAAHPQRQQAVQASGEEKKQQQQPAKSKGKGAQKSSGKGAQKSTSALESMASLKESISTVVAPFKPVARPDQGGTMGRPIKLRSNFFQMEFNSNLTIHHYDIDLTPEIRNRVRIREVFDHFVETQRPNGIFKNVFPVFDGRKNVYTAKELPLKPGRTEFEFPMHGERRPFLLKIQLANHISMFALQSFLSGQTSDAPLTAIQALDIVLREMPSHRHVTLGRFFFTDPTGDSMGTGLELWKGYYQSVRPTRWKVVMLQIDTSVRVFHKGQHLLDLVMEFFGFRNIQDLRNNRLTPRDWGKFEAHIKGLAVETTHQPDVRRTYKIIFISKFSAAEQTFPLTQPDGNEVPCKVAKYFQDQYGINLEFPNLPCLQAQPKEKHRYIPMEFCIVKKGQQLKKLTDDMTAQMIKKSAIPAPDRERRINDLVKGLNLNNDIFTKEFGLKVSTEMAKIGGRILEAPRLEYKGEVKIAPNNGSWNMREAKFWQTKDVKAMAVLCLDRYARDQSIERFVNCLCSAAHSLDMTLPRPCVSIQRVDGPNKIKDVLMWMHREYKVELVIIVMPSRKDNMLYGTVKSVGDTEIGLVTQCVQSKNVDKADPQTLANICMKINSKLGATNTIIAKDLTSPVLKLPTMIMGADVTHPSPGDFRKPSIAAVTASFDQRVCKYAAKISIQKHRVEIIEDLANITYELLQHFIKATGKQPFKIIFYRDGVSEGQFREVLAYELRAVQEACFKIGPNYQPSITFIVVQKRHKTRLFCADSRDAIGRSGNVPAGTTVDTVIVHPVEFDFYLCSHHGIQGTSRPAHYHVLYDDNNFTSDSLQQLTFQLCHVYARCTRSVSIPAPAYYAHHCAFRGRYYLDCSNDGLLPEDELQIPRALAEMNKKCVIHQLTPGMFFA